VRKVSALYVEDSLLARRVVTEYLEDILEELVVASDGEAGLAAFCLREFDVVITDVKMPGVDGFAMIEEIKKQKPQTKTIVISAFKGSEEISRMEALGVDFFLQKPLELEELKKAIQKICEA